MGLFKKDYSKLTIDELKKLSIKQIRKLNFDDLTQLSWEEIKELEHIRINGKPLSDEEEKEKAEKLSLLEYERNAPPAHLIKLSKDYVKNFPATFEINDYMKYSANTGELLLKNGLMHAWHKSNIANIIDYQVFHNGKDIQGFGIGRAIAGGLLVGNVGLLLGLTKKKEVVTELRIHLILDSIENPSFDFKLISSNTKTDSLTYKEAVKTLEKITDFLSIASYQEKRSQ